MRSGGLRARTTFAVMVAALVPVAFAGLLFAAAGAPTR